MEKSILFMGRGKKGQGVFFPCAFCGSEGVKKPETERCLMQIGEASLFRWFWS